MRSNIGQLVRSKCGRDKGVVYVIIDVKDEVYLLADGNHKLRSKPKKKNIKHVQHINKVVDDIITNEAIKHAIKLYEIKEEC